MARRSFVVNEKVREQVRHLAGVGALARKNSAGGLGSGRRRDEFTGGIGAA